MKNSYIYAIVILYYIICSLICYNLTDNIIYSILFPIGLPICIVVIFLMLYFVFFALGGGLHYLNNLFISNSVYITLKPIFALVYFFLAYLVFTLGTDFLLFEHPNVICPSDTHYYHWNIDCHFLPDDTAEYLEEVEKPIFQTYLEGRKACYECVDYYSDLNARRYSFIAFGILYVLFIIAEYLFKNNLIPSSYSIKTFFKSIINRK